MRKKLASSKTIPSYLIQNTELHLSSLIRLTHILSLFPNINYKLLTPQISIDFVVCISIKFNKYSEI